MSLEGFQPPQEEIITPKPEELEAAEAAAAIEDAHRSAQGYTGTEHPLADRVIGPGGTVMTLEERNQWDSK
jgi:hypothetical protein